MTRDPDDSGWCDGWWCSLCGTHTKVDPVLYPQAERYPNLEVRPRGGMSVRQANEEIRQHWAQRHHRVWKTEDEENRERSVK